MKVRLYTCVLICFFLSISLLGSSQEAVSIADKIIHFPSTLIDKSSNNAAAVNDCLEQQLLYTHKVYKGWPVVFPLVDSIK